MRLIDADALKENLFNYSAPEMVWDKADLNHKIDEVPTIEPERKTGRWLMKWNSFFHRELPACSECGSGAAFKTKFCPCCGAEMENAYKGVSI